MVPGYEFACYYNAAETLSGDFYDFIQLSPTRIGIVVGDVTGHGLEAAMVMAGAKKAIQILSQNQTSPASVLSAANDNLIPDLDDMTFVSVFFGILDTEKKTLRHVRAGHNQTLIFNPARESAGTQQHDEYFSQNFGLPFQLYVFERGIARRISWLLDPADLVIAPGRRSAASCRATRSTPGWRGRWPG